MQSPTEPFEFPENNEGMRLSRDRIYKQWCKERQRAADLTKRNTELFEEIVDLKRKLKFIEDRYIGD